MPKENLKLDSTFSVIGAFWKPETPDSIMTGTLMSGERTIDFTTAPVYERDPKPSAGMFDGPDKTMIPALHGFTRAGNSTLCQLVEGRCPDNSLNFPLRQSIASRTFRVLSVLEGMHVDGIEAKCLDLAKFSFAGLSDFLPSAFIEEWKAEQIVVTIPQEPREIQDFSLCSSKLRITIRAVPELTSGETDLSRLSKSVVSIEARFPQPESLDCYRRLAGRLENLFSLLTGGSVALETLFVYRGEESGHLITKRSGPPSRFDRMHNVGCSSTQLAQAIATWLSQPPKFDDVESLALEVLRKSKLFVETEFIALAQALEGFHRATMETGTTDRPILRRIRKAVRSALDAQAIDPDLKERICISMMHANDPTLTTRLKALCECFSNQTLKAMLIESATFIGEVAATRNFYTHVGGGENPKNTPKKRPVRGGQLFLLNQKMQMLLRSLMLRHVGFSESAIADVVARLPKWTVSA